MNMKLFVAVALLVQSSSALVAHVRPVRTRGSRARVPARTLCTLGARSPLCRCAGDAGASSRFSPVRSEVR